MKVSEIRQMSADELDHQVETLRRRLFEIRTQAVTEKLADGSQIKKTKRDIARILTVVKQMKDEVAN
jgi:large subunit ribosomal protein L29